MTITVWHFYIVLPLLTFSVIFLHRAKNDHFMSKVVMILTTYKNRFKRVWRSFRFAKSSWFGEMLLGIPLDIPLAKVANFKLIYWVIQRYAGNINQFGKGYHFNTCRFLFHCFYILLFTFILYILFFILICIF